MNRLTLLAKQVVWYFSHISWQTCGELPAKGYRVYRPTFSGICWLTFAEAPLVFNYQTTNLPSYQINLASLLPKIRGARREQGIGKIVVVADVVYEILSLQLSI